MEQHNNVGCVTSPQGGTLVVRDLIDITRRMKQQLGQTLKMETVEIITGAQESETCWARLVKVTEKVTVTEREKLNGVTEMGTRHVETRETQELK